MNNLKERLTTAIANYGCSNKENNFDAEDMAEYLMEAIDGLKALKRPVGSKVKIRSDLVPDENYGGTCLMEEICGSDLLNGWKLCEHRLAVIFFFGDL